MHLKNLKGNKKVFNKIKQELLEFRDFAVKGNVVDMAVGIIIGASFGGVVNSLVNDIIMPPIGWALGKVDFSELKLIISDDVSINYGLFINQIISFIIVAFAVFILVKAIVKLQAASKKKAQEEEIKEPTTKECPRCTMEVPINATRCPHCTSDI